MKDLVTFSFVFSTCFGACISNPGRFTHAHVLAFQFLLKYDLVLNFITITPTFSKADDGVQSKASGLPL